MRKIAITMMVGAAFTLPTALGAQQASRTTDDYVCAFAGQCNDQADEEEAAPANARGTPRTSSTRGFALSRPGEAKPAATNAPRKAGTALKSKGTSVAAVKRNPKPVAAQGQRADLRLSFELASATLTPVARAEAKVFAESLMRPELKNMRFAIEGHTDAQGGREYNLDLSRRRAEAVADYLGSIGVDRARLEIRGFGFDKPLGGHRPADAANRRVEAVRLS
ncbi:OmpA family protein [Allosphingosinicella indica]|uniref:OmpA family protein n=1 Tax=Allosphingosinicella indica TaxID=941907 RepID=A0A1X7GJE1_9SPHN|nr:OmpA family protein [Allosphingosinicella indica]SMF70719.1 OmpA family protein [Allosphingosinicella indica]